jgi:type I restriction enzyme M protein
MTKKLTLQELEAFLWQTADVLRGNMDASQFKDHIFGLMFHKCLSDALEQESEGLIGEIIGEERR